jgi:hypothetical protein
MRMNIVTITEKNHVKFATSRRCGDLRKVLHSPRASRCMALGIYKQEAL